MEINLAHRQLCERARQGSDRTRHRPTCAKQKPPGAHRYKRSIKARLQRKGAGDEEGNGQCGGKHCESGVGSPSGRLRRAVEELAQPTRSFFSDRGVRQQLRRQMKDENEPN
jgi:hypothetical protein